MRRRRPNRDERSAYYGRVLFGQGGADRVAVYGKKAETAWERALKGSKACNALK
jgi:hypothetical protein